MSESEKPPEMTGDGTGQAGQAAGEGPWLEETPISRYPQLVRGAAARKGAQDVMEVLAT